MELQGLMEKGISQLYISGFIILISIMCQNNSHPVIAVADPETSKRGGQET